MIYGNATKLGDALAHSSSNIVLLVLSQKAIAVLYCFGLSHIELWIGFFLFLKDDRQVNVCIYVTLNICKLFRWVCRVALEDDFVVVAPLLQLAEIKLFIDVNRVLLGKLGQALLEVRVERSRVNQKSVR